MLIAGLNKTTLLDYPGRVAATIFTGGCNFRCPFCHNGDLVIKPSVQGVYSEEEIFSFLKMRRNLLKGVCITGGEPTLQADLPDFLTKIKEIGYDVKLDTNGYQPGVLQELLQKKLIDYVAMDIKNCRGKYAETAGKADFDIGRIEKSIELLRQAQIPYEFRTTVVKEFHTMQDILAIGEWIAGCPQYFLQQYQGNEKEVSTMVYGVKSDFHGYDKEEMEKMKESLQRLFQMTGKVELRGIG